MDSRFFFQGITQRKGRRVVWVQLPELWRLESAGKYLEISRFEAARFWAQFGLDFLVDSLGIKAGYEHVWEEEKEAKSLQVVALDLVARWRRNSCLKMAIRNIHERKKKSGFKNSEL
ncbi:hypothetical protein L3X38_004396 [Prunus dulcis]|uniref:Uncharacterized protein n=1 Tax=Prunus dulcis TaxID=3755 RepID=A0AAD4ZNT4_PRUDU|nr:hypothetical protein L3X38_004396 [Prunus dulcis]